MFPTAYEFHWDLGHLIFLGIFYVVLTVVATGLGVALHRQVTDMKARRDGTIRWREAFHALPAERRRCRHDFTGAAPSRICDNAFDCRTCRMHPEFAKAERAAGPVPSRPRDLGLALPERRFYHRGHTWVEPESDGTLRVGLDDLAGRCLGRPDRVVLPPAGRVLREGDPGAVLERGRFRAPVFTPVGGEVVELGDFTDGWLYSLWPAEGSPKLEHLLRGPEVDAWMTRELEWLQGALRGPRESAALADGGRLVDDLMAACPDADWDGVWSDLCLPA